MGCHCDDNALFTHCVSKGGRFCSWQPGNIASPHWVADSANIRAAPPSITTCPSGDSCLESTTAGRAVDIGNQCWQLLQQPVPGPCRCEDGGSCEGSPKRHFPAMCQLSSDDVQQPAASLKARGRC